MTFQSDHWFHVCSFSGAIADLPPRARTRERALATLAQDGRVSTWDMSESAWLRDLISGLVRDGMIRSVPDAFPWHRYEVTDSGSAYMRRSGLPTARDGQGGA